MQQTLELLEEVPEFISKQINVNSLIKQDNSLILGRWKMNLNQTRIFLIALSHLEPNQDNFIKYKIKASDLITLLELKGNSLYKQIHIDMPILKAYTIQVRHSARHTEWISLFDHASYYNGDLYVRFHDEMKPFLLNLQNKFTQFKLSEAMKFRSLYALRFFMMLKQFDSQGWRYMSVDEIRHSLNLNKTDDNNLDADMYPKVNDLKKRVILPAIDELNKTGFVVNIKEAKESRSIVGFRFEWNNLTLPEKIEFNPKTDKQQRLLDRLKGFGLTDKQVRFLGDIVGKVYTLEELNQTCYAVDLGLKKKGITEPGAKGGYAYTVFKKKYNLPKAEF